MSSSLRRQYFRRLRRTISAGRSPEQSGESDGSPLQSPVSLTSLSLSPVTPGPGPDTMGLLRPDSPTRGLGMFHKVFSLDTLFQAEASNNFFLFPRADPLALPPRQKLEENIQKK